MHITIGTFRILIKHMGTLMSMSLTSFCKGIKVKLLLPLFLGVSAECDSQERQLFAGANTGLFKYDYNTHINLFYAFLLQN